jgi:MYXO-CTERM domain-containing protein
VLVQAKTNGCAPSTAAGAAGTSGGAAKDATGGGAGATEPAIKPGSMGVTSGFCFSNPTSNPQCTAAQPVCDVTSGFCDKCDGGFGSGTPSACASANAPVCAADGSCHPCAADYPDPNGCETIALQTCVLSGPNQGQCIKCTSNADCAGHENRTSCDVVSGACGTACTTDADCSNVQWCTGAHVCIPKTPNGDPVPNEDPIDGNCTPDNGRRACLSGVCEMSDNLCGLKNGDPCNGAGECRSDICFSDGDCGLPFGQPCSGNDQCRSDKCENGTCTGCVLDKDCGLGLVCDTTQMQCVPGCKSDEGCPPPSICSAHDGSVGQCVNAPVGEGGVTDGGFVDTSGIVEGGGCSCRTASLTDAGRPLGIGGLAAAVLFFVRRRKNRST